MSDASIRIEQARGALDYAEALLDANGLPSDDVGAKLDCLYVAYDASTAEHRVGVGGLERYGTDGLLRSLAIEEQHRGQGLGTALCERLEAKATAEGVEALYLLTTTASEFFAARGYEETDRAEVPPAIRDTTEFAELCPDSAVCMRKLLSDEAL